MFVSVHITAYGENITAFLSKAELN